MTQPQPQPNQDAINRLKQAGFSDIAQPVPQRLISKVAGPEKTGKSHLALTGTPPIIYFSIDIGTEGVVEKFQRNGKQILTYDIQIKKGGNPQDYKDAWAKLDQCLDMAVQVGTGTIVFDTWTEMYELARLSHFGGRMDKVNPGEYPVVYADLREKIRRIYEKSGMSAVLITKMGRAFGEGKGLEEKGFSDTGFLVQCNMETARIEVQDQKTGAARSVFTVKVRECRQNAKMNNLVLASEMPNAQGQVENKFDLTYLTYLVHNWA